MLTSTVSDKGQVVIPAAYRRLLGIKPGSALDFEIEGNSMRVHVLHETKQSSINDGYGMLLAKGKKQRHLGEFDVALSMKKK